jgi:hypothetical protein
MAKTRLADENADALGLIPPAQPDGSGIGANYVDAYVQAMNVELEDGRKVACKRKGLKITLAFGDREGEALLRRIENGPDVKNILRRCLEEAASAAGASFVVEDGTMYLAE